MQTVKKNSVIRGQQIDRAGRRPHIRAMVATWRLGSDDYLRSVDFERPPPPAPMTSADAPPVSTFDNSQELAGLVEQALLRTKEILTLPINNDSEESEINARSRMLLSGIRTVLQTQLRADDNVLKRRAQTAHTALLRDLKAAQARMAAGEDARMIDG